ncbi:hypothetical protein CVIRNUC_008241 [Coccomyxa viridis]|uniref:Uncharacterized protein n=1 Tax=Coccomyxa viridis TaxID=1274662 RepID=A0AAV1IE06_9CHLO|nr:hypothetical protein CVIRNUC_008241 [Coccomyxa viridis]
MTSVTGGRQLHCLPSGPQGAFRLSHSIPFRQAACTQPLLQQRRCLEGHGKRQVRNAANPFDLAWGTSLNVDAQSLAANLFASSIFPYAAFLYFLTKSKKTPGKALFGFYFLLVFVFATIPAGIYAKVKYGTILANVDWLHGSAESFLTLTNLFIVFGVREGIRDAERAKLAEQAAAQGMPVPAEETQKAQKP